MINKIKRKIYFALSNNKSMQGVLKLLIMVNNILFHWNERQKMYHYGDENPDDTYYVIRPSGNTEGLLSTYFYVTESVSWAKKKNYIPFVDFSDSTCQYYVGREINGTYNAWEYFFKQPSDVRKEDLVSKRNVLKSGWFVFDKYQCRREKDEVQNGSEGRIKKDTNIAIQDYILKKAYELKNKILKDKNVLGVFIRGTDYVKLRPKGHSVQPTIDQICEKVDEMISKSEIDQIYLVTEDYDYYLKIKEKYGSMVVVADDRFVKNYDKKEYISDVLVDDPYERGLSYLIRLIILSECDYMVSSIASGSIFVKNIRKRTAKEEYWFDLGTY